LQRESNNAIFMTENTFNYRKRIADILLEEKASAKVCFVSVLQKEVK